MESSAPSDRIDLEARIRRSQGRGGRRHSATAKLTREELNEIEAIAAKQHKAVGEWAREVLLNEARRPTDDPLLTELTSIRMLLVVLIKPLLLKQTVTAEWITEALTIIRREKRKATQETLEQYRDEHKGGH